MLFIHHRALCCSVLFGVLALGALGAGPARALTINLLTNPGAETGALSGWTVGGTSNPKVDNGTFDPGINPHTGSFDFSGGTGAEGTLTQTVTLVGNQGITAAAIDSGTDTAVVGFFEQGLSQGTPSDDARIVLTFLNGSSATISTSSTPEVDSHGGNWEEATESFAIPTGTRFINYTMDFIRHSGSDNDGFVDDNSLQVGSLITTPEPGSVVLFGAGMVGLAGVVRRRRRGSAPGAF